MLLSIETEPASDAWGFVGVVKVGDVKAYRTLESHPTPPEALAATQALLSTLLGEALAGAEWRQVRTAEGHPPSL